MEEAFQRMTRPSAGANSQRIPNRTQITFIKQKDSYGPPKLARIHKRPKTASSSAGRFFGDAKKSSTKIKGNNIYDINANSYRDIQEATNTMQLQGLIRVLWYLYLTLIKVLG